MSSTAHTVHMRQEDFEAMEARKAERRDYYNQWGMWWRTRKRPIRRLALVTIDGRQHIVIREKDGSYKLQVRESTYLVFAQLSTILLYIKTAKALGPWEGVKPRVTRRVKPHLEQGRVVNKSVFVHPDIAVHALTAYWQQRYWDGMAEAARRSQSAPGWLRWETIAVRPQANARPPLTVIETTVADVAAELGKPDRLEKAAHWDNEGAIRLVNWLLDEHADPRRWNTARHIAEELVAEAEGRYDWKTGTITPKSPTDSRPYLERFTDAPANLTSSHIMAAIEDLAQTAAFQDAMRKGDVFQLGFGIRIKRGQHGCDIYCPLPPGRGERWGHMSRGIEVVNVRDGKYLPIGAQRFQGNIQRFVLDVLPRIVIEEAAA
jgi:hypothetical protein